MTHRRLLLLAGLLGLVISAARPAIGAPADLEATGYGGTASGGWACGPDAHAKYGGVGGEIRLRPGVEKAEDPDGAFVALAAAGEHRAFTLIDCGSNPCSSSNDVVPPSGMALGASARGGYDSRWFGLRLGLLTWQNWRDPTDTSAKWNIWPDASIRIGPTTSFRGELGIGEYSLSTLLRPGFWIGFGYAPAPGWDIALHGGANQTFDGLMLGWRTDLALKVPISQALQLGVGTALSEGVSSGVDPEGRLSLIVHVP